MSLSNDDILQLVKGCIQNSRSSQHELYKLLYDHAYSTTYRYSNHNQDTNDLVNESFLKLFKNIHSCELSHSTNAFISIKAWFKRIIVNTCIDQYRGNIRKISLLELPYSMPDNSENGENKIGYKEIIDAVRHLSPAYRTVFNLHAIEGYSHEEISKLLDISIGTSKSNLSKARELLRTMIKQKTNFKLPHDATAR